MEFGSPVWHKRRALGRLSSYTIWISKLQFQRKDPASIIRWGTTKGDTWCPPLASICTRTCIHTYRCTPTHVSIHACKHTTHMCTLKGKALPQCGDWLRFGQLDPFIVMVVVLPHPRPKSLHLGRSVKYLCSPGAPFCCFWWWGWPSDYI